MSEIIRTEAVEINTSYQEAVNLHHQIIANGELAVNSFMEMCRCFKKMRDTGLYKELGYSTFEEYCENAVGVKQRQVYKYIMVYERFGETQLQKHADLGITKLELIASVPAEDRAEFVEENDLSSMSVKEIKELVDELTQKGEQIKFLENEIDELRSAGVEQDIRDDEKVEELNNEITSLKAKITELENKPVDAAELDKAAVESIRKEAEKAAKKEYEQELKKAREDAKVKMEEKLKKVQEEKEQAEERLRQLASESAEANERAKKLEKELRLKSSAATTEVTVYFGQLQDCMSKIIQKVEEIKKEDPETGKKLGGAMVKYLEKALPACKPLAE